MSNNSALCQGKLGSATTPNASLAKAVPVTLSSAGFSATVGHVSRLTATSDYTSFVIPITNIGTTVQCFIMVTDGQAGSYAISSFVRGSVGYSGATYTDSCLAPSESGYLIDITEDVSYDAVSSISLAVAGETGFTISSDRVIPQSYTLDAATSELSVTVKNAGPLAVSLVDGFPTYILFDGADQALDFSFLSDTSSTDLAPGSSDRLTDYLLFYGNAVRTVVFVDFEEGGAAGALRVAPTPEDAARLAAVKRQRARVHAAWTGRN